MPIQARGRFPKPTPIYREDGSSQDRRPTVLTTTTIEEYRALKGMPRSEEALELLQDVGKAVKPIMVKHRWKLPLLVEIYPKQQSLLGFNVNSGRKIALRLRQASQHDAFIDRQSLVETMLHELAHNLRGPHDEIFFQHLEFLTQEWYEVQNSGTHLLPGQGFLSRGVRLGGRGPLPDLFTAREKAAEKAERRRLLGGLTDHATGRRLVANVQGARPLTHAEVSDASASAVERRRMITQNCPNNNASETQQAAEEQEEQEFLHGIQVITIDDEEEDIESETASAPINTTSYKEAKREHHLSDEDDIVIVDVKKAPPKKKHLQERESKIQPAQLLQQTRAAAALRHGLLSDATEIQDFQRSVETPNSAQVTSQSRSWTCQTCTLLNEISALVCLACEEVRPGLEHWRCAHCQHRMLGEMAQYWCCTKCDRMRVS